ncbi:MAG TPA: hypothetical protein VNU68_28775 [Verrucomicrobiae bacterium]|nr:hypothetical protein [Verrucomicrobiae bacterium]
MNSSSTRREFLADVGRGMLIASVGSSLAADLGLAPAAFAAEGPDAAAALNFGDLESLVCLMQETPADKLLPKLTAELKRGTELRRLVAAGALANARTFGGEDYVGFHTLMALSPAFRMAGELSGPLQPLPVFKVLYRNTNRLQEKGGRKDEVLHPVKAGSPLETKLGSEQLRDAIHRQDVNAAEQTFATLAQLSPEDAFNHLLHAVQDYTEVHRVVLPYRAWDLLDVTGREHAHTLLRQSVRYCVRNEASHPANWEEPRTLLPKQLEQHHLLDHTLGTREADDAWVDQFVQLLFKSTPAQAAEAAAAALAEGFAPAHIGEAIALTANQLVLRDHGRRPSEESAGKPPGSVHGDSIGVHASDSANAWRNMARVSNARNTHACLILGAYQVALDRTNRGGDFQNWQPIPVKWHLDQIKTATAEGLLKEADEAIRQNLQGHAAALVHRYGELGYAPRPVFDLLLRYAISEDGALHAEKYYRTVTEEFNSTRPAFRWRQLVALARVTASEYGRPAPGMAQARELLG